jgi:hypothetical protein
MKLAWCKEEELVRVRYFYQNQPTAAAAADPANLDDTSTLGGYHPAGSRGAQRLTETAEGSALRAHLPPGFDSTEQQDDTGNAIGSSRGFHGLESFVRLCELATVYGGHALHS